MVQKTNGIVLRSVKYGDTSLVVTIFTESFGVQAYIVQGVRSTSARNKAAYFQPATMLEMVVYAQPGRSMNHIREYRASYLYKTVSEHIVKNTIALFCAEVMLRLLPENAPMADMFSGAVAFLCALDELPDSACANAPLFFLSRCGGLLGYAPKGIYADETPYLDIVEGGFSSHPPSLPPFTGQGEARALGELLMCSTLAESSAVSMTGEVRLRLTDWYIAFMQLHSDHMGNIRSLPVLRAILR